MEGPGGTFYGSAAGASAANAEAINANTQANQENAVAIAETAADTEANTAAIAAKVGVPLGGVIWFRTAAELTAAGASWTRETNLDGRLPIGAGTTFSQTFAEATNYGANWTPSSGLGATAGNLASASVFTATAADTTVNLKTVTPQEASASATTHQHLVPAAAVTGAPALTGTSTAWLPPMRSGVFARRV